MTRGHGKAVRFIWCEPHSKRCYITRSEAREVIRRVPERKGMREYRCDAYPDSTYWHIGHLPGPVRRGAKTMREWGQCP